MALFENSEFVLAKDVLDVIELLGKLLVLVLVSFVNLELSRFFSFDRVQEVGRGFEDSVLFSILCQIE
jgi:hypothetical protein